MSEPDIARDGGPFNLKEALVALNFHSVKAWKRGDYGAHSDLTKISEFIENLIAERAAEAREIARAVRASVESLS
jgi:hypothetical protein